MDQRVDELWNETALHELYRDNTSDYQAAVLEQYRMYVEMADRISERRGTTNTFFLSLNTTFFALVGVFWKDHGTPDPRWLLFALIAILGQCGTWFYLVRSYRLLNSAKYLVVGALEERLPASPFSRAEWHMLGEGHDWRKYWPLSHVEQWIPVLFAVTYVAAAVAALLT